MFMWRLLSAAYPASDDSEIGSLMSLKEFRPVFTFETIEERSSLVMYTVMRSASNSWQMSRETSRMISSMLLVEWIRLVTACSFFEKASLTLMSATFAPGGIFVSSTALMVLSSQREFLVVLEHPRAPPPRRFAHFLHGERALARLQVRDEHLGLDAHLLELLREQLRAEVLRRDRDVALLVGERGLDDQVLQVGRGVHGLPQCVVGRSVAAEDERVASVVEHVAHGRNRVVRGDRGEYAAAKGDALADADLAIRHERLAGVGDLREVGPELPVEEVRPEDVEGLLDGVDLDGAAPHPAHGVHEERDARHVIEVRMAHEDMVDLGELLEREIAHARTRIDQHVVVDEERCGAEAAADAPAASQYTDLHRLS